MWGARARHQNIAGEIACWEVIRDLPEWGQSPHTFFEETYDGVHCASTDWYENSVFAAGNFDAGREAPALLGFDSDIHSYCNNNCDAVNANILNLFSSVLKYNSCRKCAHRCKT